MSTIDRHIPNRQLAARNAADRRKKRLLVGLFALLVGVLAFQLPKLMHSSGSSSHTTSPPVTTPATSTPAATGGQTATSAATSGSAKGVRAIGQMTSHDPFVPVAGTNTPASAFSSSSAPASRSASSSASAPASPSASSSASAPSASASSSSSASGPASASVSQPTSHSAAPTVVSTASAPSSSAAGHPAVASPAAPTAAVMWTNGQRQVVGIGHTFHVGDATFELAAVDGPTVRLRAPVGSFTGGKRTITIHKGRDVTLENNATGVLYTLRFGGGTSNGS